MSQRVVSLAVLTVVMAASPARAAVTAWTNVVVRVYDTTGAPVAPRQASLDVASSIVSSTSIAVSWRVCGPSSTDAPARGAGACDNPMREGELAVRIVRLRAPGGREGVPLGDALVDTRSGAAVLATVYEDRVARLAAETGADPAVLLGRAIAHELGHLLLASNRHARNGLMRPRWSVDEIRRNQGRDWAFAPADAALIRERLARRDAAGSVAIE